MSIILKRLISEIPELETLYKTIQIIIESNEPIRINVKNRILYDNIGEKYDETISFTLPKDYPFKPPLVLKNNKSFLAMIPHIQLTDYIKEIQKPMPFIGECLHCNFITKDIWTPVMRMKDILIEIEKVEQTQRIIQEYILLTHLSCKTKIPKEITHIIHAFL